MLAPSPKRGADFRILLIEDNRYDAELTKAIVQVYVPCDITTVNSRAAFEAELDQGAPHLILSDSSLAGFDGKQALAFVMEKYPQAPFVFFTGNVTEAFKAEALAGGAADCICKADVLALISVVRRFCRDS